MPRLSDPPRPTPAPRKRAASAENDSENSSQQTDRSAAKSQKTSAHSKTLSRVEAEPGVVLSVKMINFKNHSHTVQAGSMQPPSVPPPTAPNPNPNPNPPTTACDR